VIRERVDLEQLCTIALYRDNDTSEYVALIDFPQRADVTPDGHVTIEGVMTSVAGIVRDELRKRDTLVPPQPERP